MKVTKKLQRQYRRILEISEDSQQITLHDSRYYKRNGEYYPSVTTILGMFPKGNHFEEWLKKVGFASNHIVKKAADEGTQVHDLIEKYLLGEEINYLYDDGNPKFSQIVWSMFLKFVEFWETYNPVLVETEVHLFSDELKTAGTCDLICEINGELWLIDYKSSNFISPTYEMQVSVYGKSYEECYNKKIDKYGVLWLKSSKRKLNLDKMYGPGWEMVLPTRKPEENIEIFKLLQKIWKIVNPKDKPNIAEIKTTVKREH